MILTGDVGADELNVQGTAPSTSRQRGGAALLGPLWEGAVGAADWGRENAWPLSLRQRFALTPPSQREALGRGFSRR